MSIRPDDPRLTAYLHGELPAAESAAIDAALAADATLRAEVDALRRLEDDLRASFDEDLPSMHPQQRAAIAAAAGDQRPPAAGNIVRFSSLLMLAAGMLLAVGLGAIWHNLREPRISGTEQAEQEPSIARRIDSPTPVEASPPAPTEASEVLTEVPSQAPVDAIVAESERHYESIGSQSGGLSANAHAPGDKDRPSKPASAGATPDMDYQLQPDGLSSDSMEESVVLSVGAGAPNRPAIPAPESSGWRESKTQGDRSRLDDPAPACIVPPVDPAPGWRPTEPATQRSTFTRVDVPGGDTSTFSVDVDTASYAQLRQALRQGQRPAPEVVRIEEMINYFDYGYAAPTDGQSFAVDARFSDCPWNPRHRLLRFGLKGQEVDAADRPALNLVFLVDVSGSMKSDNKLPLLQRSLHRLLPNLQTRDRVAIVTYATTARVVLPSTPADQRARIVGVIDGLVASGSTHGEAGIRLAYEEARQHLLADGVNRVILASDGDFNVGMQDLGQLRQLIGQQAEAGIQLTVLGLGMGDYRDDLMETLADNGDGNYAYIDDLREAHKVLHREFLQNVVTIASDVKFQIFFNPRQVAGWRLLGYANRQLAASAFNDDSADAGDIGAGHEVTAIYELVPAGQAVPAVVDANPFTRPAATERAATTIVADDEAVLRWRLRYQPPQGGASQLREFDLRDDGADWAAADADTRWAIGVAAIGLLLRDTPQTGSLDYDLAARLLQEAASNDRSGHRGEFLELVDRLRPAFR